MNELKFGHNVLAWDNDKSNAKKGRYIAFDEGYTDYQPHSVLVEGEVNEELFINCELDSEAEGFLIGDDVEFSSDGKAVEIDGKKYELKLVD